jgi:uncharacterized protein with FMN-binding domain
MRRALLVTVGTVAGLATVLSYSDGQVSIAGDLASAAGPAEGLGAPPADETPAASESASPSESPSAAATKGAKPKPSSTAKASAKPTKAAATTAAADPGAPAADPTTAAPKPTPTKAAPKPTPKPKPTPTKSLPNGDFVGSAVTHRYGTVQVGIRVVDGKITKAWAAKYPTGESSPYSEFSIPKLSSETVGARSASVAAVSGATLTSKAWVSSLASAMSKAGI